LQIYKNRAKKKVHGNERSACPNYLGEAPESLSGSLLEGSQGAEIHTILVVLQGRVGSAGFSTGLPAQTSTETPKGTTTETPTKPLRNHVVTLSWKANETTVVVGYNIYRSEVEGTGYVKLNAAPLATPSFVDATLLPGKTYYYVSTAVNSKGMESPRSNEIQAIIPD
jgi:fibronectin type 3 domain-containing protein